MSEEQRGRQVAVVAGSDRDVKAVEEVVSTLKKIGIANPCVCVLSAERHWEQLSEFCQALGVMGIDLIIALAGKAAILPSSIASITGYTIPIIGVPLLSGSGSVISDLAALLSIFDRPDGAPLITVNSPVNAAMLAGQLLSMKDNAVRAGYRRYLVEAVARKPARIGTTVEEMRAALPKAATA